MKHYHTTASDVWLPFEFSVGPVLSRFYEGLKEEIIWGTRCPKCQKVLVPARSFCPECHVDMVEWVEVSSEGKIFSWTLVDEDVFGAPYQPPYILALIRLDQTDCNFLHIVSGIDFEDRKAVKRTIKKDTRVQAKWRQDKQGHMMDIAHFEPC